MKPLPPIPNSFTETVASRSLTVRRGEALTPMVVEIGRPIQDVVTVSGMDWRCPIRFVSGAEEVVRSACGVDSFQCLQLAFGVVSAELRRRSDELNADILFFDGPYDLDSHLPSHPPGNCA